MVGDKIICLTLGAIETNCYFFSYSDCLCVIDPAICNQQLLHTIDEICIDEKLHFSSVFLTHGHLDHVAGIGELKKKYPDIKVYISKYDSQYLGNGSYDFQYNDFAKSGMGGFVQYVLPDKNDLPCADELFSDGEMLFPSWQVIATPGHTKGSSCLYNEKKGIVFTGDTLMFNSYGRTDMTGGSDYDMENSLKKIKTLPKDTVVYPGHDIYGFRLSECFLWGLL